MRLASASLVKYIESAQLRVEYSIYSCGARDTDTTEKSISSMCQVGPRSSVLPHLSCQPRADVQYYLALGAKIDLLHPKCFRGYVTKIILSSLLLTGRTQCPAQFPRPFSRYLTRSAANRLSKDVLRNMSRWLKRSPENTRMHV